MANKDGHTHKCTECGVEYRHYSSDTACKEPPETKCGVCKKK